jgi:RNase P protein component
MLPRRLRLSRASFPGRTAGARASSESFSVVSGPSKGGGCAAVVGKSVARRANARNLLKRRMLAVLRPWCSPDRYLVVYAKAAAATLPYRTLAAELTGLLRRLRS